MANHEQLNRLIVSVKDNNRCKSWNDWIRDNKLLDMSRLDLSRTYLSRFHLFKIDLSEIDLYQINLAEANLTEVNLSKSNLFFTNLCHANLFRANLSCAKLSQANLEKADLSEANLSGADLVGAKLREANLRGANLKNVHLCSAYFISNENEKVLSIQFPLSVEQICQTKNIEGIRYLSAVLLSQIKEKKPELVEWWDASFVEETGENGEWTGYWKKRPEKIIELEEKKEYPEKKKEPNVLADPWEMMGWSRIEKKKEPPKIIEPNTVEPWEVIDWSKAKQKRRGSLRIPLDIIFTYLLAFFCLGALGFLLNEASYKETKDDLVSVKTRVEVLRDSLQKGKASFQRNNFGKCNLEYMNLSNLDFTEVNFKEANLVFCDLKESIFTRGNLLKAKLDNANLQYSLLEDANLEEASLKYANLRYSDLSGANLSRAKLMGCDLKMADLSGADLSEADLSHSSLNKVETVKNFLWLVDLICQAKSIEGARFLSHRFLSEVQRKRPDLMKWWSEDMVKEIELEEWTGRWVKKKEK